LKLDVFTLFPEHFEWFAGQRHVRNALAAGSELRLIDYRDSTPLRGGRVDDTPYGGGAGMVMRVDVVDAALEAAYGQRREAVRRGPGRRAVGGAAPGPALRALRGT
jgi:tRNA (guanine37-N1)-methyltransferase